MTIIKKSNLCHVLRRTAALLCALAALFGCASKNLSLKRPDFAAHEMWSEIKHSRTISTPLNFLSLDGKHLMIEMREVEVAEGQSDIEAIIQALIAGPTDTRTMRGILSTSIELVSAHVSGSVANITLTSNFAYYREDEMLKVRAAIANTLSPVLGVDYINVYVDGKDPGYLGMPLGSTAPTTLDLTLYCDQVIQEQNNIMDDDGYDESRIVTFYVADSSHSYLVASPRSVEITPMLEGDTIVRGYLTAAVQTLLVDQEYEDMIGSGYILNGPPSTQTDENGERFASVVLTELPDNQLLGLGSLVYSVTGFVCNIAYVTVSIKDNFSPTGITPIDRVEGLGDVAGGRLYRSMFEELLADEVTLYIPGNNGLTLDSVGIYLPVDRCGDPYELISRLFDRQELSGLSRSDVLGAKLCDKTAVINLDSAALNALRELDDRGEYLAVYSIVNTLTELRGIERVQFLFEGSTVQGLDSIVLSGQLMRNPGIIQ